MYYGIFNGKIKLFCGHEEGFVIMGVNALANFTDARATAGFNPTRAGFIDMRSLLRDVLVLQSLIKIFIRERVARAYVHLVIPSNKCPL